MSVLTALLNEQGFVVLDGGLATELETRGESLNHALWSAKILLEKPEVIGDVHLAYFEAGADVATTASYQATFPGLAAQGLSKEQAEQVMLRSVTVAAEARERFWSDGRNRVGRQRPLIAASIGPYGAFLHDGSEYHGNYGVGYGDLKEFHRERLQLLAKSGADLLACESIPSLVEAKALAELLRDLPDVPAWISFTCKDEGHISDGTAFADAVTAVSAVSNVVAIGMNCTAPKFVNALLEKAHSVTDKPLVAYPNSGELYDISTCGWKATSEAGMIEEAARGWLERGARLIGGCCRTTPETITGIRKALSAAVFVPASSGSN